MKKLIRAIWITLQTISVALESEALAAAINQSPPSTPPKVLRSSRDYHLLQEVPHDASSFTQGLTYFNGHIYEGTGMEESSHIMRHDPSNEMKTLDKIPLVPSKLFGEGISHYFVWKTDKRGNRIKEHRLIQLTWRDKLGKIYSLPELKLLNEFHYDTGTGEGWGVTFIPHRNEFYVSDGSATLVVWDAETLREKRRVTVTFERKPGRSEEVKFVNELEFVDFATTDDGDAAAGEGARCEETGTCAADDASPFSPTMRILANIWYQDVLVSICPQSGKITRVYDLRDIFPLEEREKEGSDCLNGISVSGTPQDGGGLEVWVTGKLWPKMYRIRLIE